jgi:hypothetical protein
MTEGMKLRLVDLEEDNKRMDDELKRLNISLQGLQEVGAVVRGTLVVAWRA